MASVHDVVAYILKRRGATTAMKLQKLLYYAQAWSLVWDERPLFQARIEAWANGPVVREVWKYHRGMYLVRTWEAGNADALKVAERETVDAVLGFYGDKTPQWLSDLTHMEAPWQEARKGVPIGQACGNEITPAAMLEYYSSLEPVR